MSTPAAFPDRDTTAAKLSSFGEAEQAFVKLLMENPEQDENLMEGLHHHLDLAAEARFLNTLKLERVGEWLGNEAPPRLQMRLMEVARSSQHAAYQAFRSGLIKSGGLQRAFPKA
ncbi:hypothetical protein [Sinorhizobium americanum]|uniref:Uncharacterized protein n=1 Tax=Sinorhizobium americanum TaxID=194963 RepID=A0A1L3LN12_9HYPH|nr:hypothetical protein [Sinorhizobium americanum]APG84848.1 hypothetical protein SAMCCGM7_Ch2103 [Sinorhizobium americanum CCGM7]APG91492.1 hypothetical protein SAMCFNEI73_Ch2209 [Sinorhizobium americanum]OAP37459.1 hypothetical protein ATC00_10280 [Sinorhizobium americanum]TCN29057.1 hypothetical protein EV184_111159 [Sinorhizobium americanum]